MRILKTTNAKLEASWPFPFILSTIHFKSALQAAQCSRGTLEPLALGYCSFRMGNRRNRRLKPSGKCCYDSFCRWRKNQTARFITDKNRDKRRMSSASSRMNAAHAVVSHLLINHFKKASF